MSILPRLSNTALPSRAPFLHARPALGANAVLVVSAVFLVLCANMRFWQVVWAAPGIAGIDAVRVLAAVALALFALTVLILLPLGIKGLLRPGLCVVFALSAAAAYFMDAYGAVIDRHALASVYQSDARETAEWLSPHMLPTLLLLCALPMLLLARVRLRWRAPLAEAFSRLKLAALAFALLALAAALAGKDVASLLRNRMELRHLANPFALVSAQLSYLDHLDDGARPLQRIAVDARRGAALRPAKRPVLLVLAIGESARAANFDFNGYLRDTDLALHPLPLVNFRQVHSCGTNTATSLPCMFSGMGRAGYDDGAMKHRENLLDALARAGYDVLWLDNNTGSKGLAKRVRERYLADARDPALCNAEGCYDEILVRALGEELRTLRRDTVIVTHMLGSHGPAYYARYPPAWAVFQPECRTNQLQTCSDAQLRNSYDNSLLYTGQVLARMVALLGESRLLPPSTPPSPACLAATARGEHARPGACATQIARSATSAETPAAQGFDAALLFVSDHGESLGEKGLYLHGAPYAIAPDEQTWVPMLFWTSEHFRARRGLDLGCLRAGNGAALSHDHFFHSVLGLADVATRDYRPELDVFAPCLHGAG